MQNIIKAACQFIAKHEGLRLKAYLCPAGVPTIGYGDTEYLKQFKDPLNETITIEKAEELLATRVKADYEILLTLVRIALTTNQTITLLSLMFNIGREAFKNSTLLKKLNLKAPAQEIEFEFLRWNKVKGKENKGLMVRRKREWEIFLK